MKKVLLTLALAAFAFTANAQWVIGGRIDLNHNGAAAGDYNTTAATNFTLMPKVGYWLNETMQVGVQFGANYAYTRNYDGDNNNDHYRSATQLVWNFNPYFRYNLTSWKNFTVFAEAQVLIGITPKSSWKTTNPSATGDGTTSAFDLGVNIVPGLNYALTDHISIDIYVNLARIFYNYNSTTTSTTVGTATVDNTNTTHDWGFGANMNSQTINAHLNNFSIGFNYAF